MGHIVTCPECHRTNQIDSKSAEELVYGNMMLAELSEGMPNLIPICGYCKAELPYGKLLIATLSSVKTDAIISPVDRLSLIKRMIVNTGEYTVTYGIGGAVLWLIVLGIIPPDWRKSLLYAAGTLVLFASLYTACLRICANEITKREKSVENERKIVQEITSGERRLTDQAIADAEVYKASLKERAARFPTILSAIDNYERLRDERLIAHLRYKPHPAMRSAEVIQEQSARRRRAETDFKRASYLIEYYESIAPFLVDLREDLDDGTDDDLFRAYDEDEQRDPAIDYLTKEEFRKLPTATRNQMALDRFWKRPKSRWLLGRMYERYIGYLYEANGYDVTYEGIIKGYQDLGRDLICHKDDEVIVVQCKNWSKFKTIYEKHIFQFFGTVFQYNDSMEQEVEGLFCTTTTVSDLARRFATELGIGLSENFKFNQNYPCIKCNVSRVDGSRIYHLPFDQQYDKVKIEPSRGEFYCQTVKEAEAQGFRRAYSYKGIGDTVE